MENRSNKNIVTDFYKKVIGQRDLSQIDFFISEHYIQHSAMGKDGKAGILEMLQLLKTLPPPEPELKSPVTMAIADGDLVALQLDVNFMGKRMLVIDIFRIENGQLAEHWDVMQHIPQEAVNELGREMHKADDPTEPNKVLVADYVNNVFVEKQLEKAFEYITAGSHTRNVITSGRLNHILSSQFRDYQLKIHKVIGEGNLVLVQSSYNDANNNLVLNDIFEIADHRIVRSWSVEQAIPSKMMHDNGML
jgi:predicted SnoaL-like aldol condensation-catalyzing enzyme